MKSAADRKRDRKVLISVNLDAAQLEALRAVAAERRVPLALLVRDAIAAYLSALALPAQSGAYTTRTSAEVSKHLPRASTASPDGQSDPPSLAPVASPAVLARAVRGGER